MDNGLEALSASGIKENLSPKSSFGATIRFVKEKKSRENHVSASSRSSDEEPGVELEGLSNPTKKGSSSWRLAAMFAKSQSNSKSDKAPSKQSVFPNNGNILKKKARSTILSVLSKRQTQEKLFLEERSDGRQNSSVGASESTLHQPSEAMIGDLTSTRPNPHRPSYAVVKSQTYQLAPSNEGSDSIDSWVSQVQANEQGKLSSRVVDASNVAQARGLDVLDGDAKVGKISSRWPPQARHPDSDGDSLGWRRASAPKHLPCPSEMESAVRGSDAMVLSMSPSYTSVKDITQDTPLSPKSESDSVMVSIPFQVQGQKQPAEKPDQRCDAWSSSVSICVPFQVNENGDGVSVLPSGPSLQVDSNQAALDGRASEDERDGKAVPKPRAHSSLQPGRRTTPKEAYSRDKKTKESPKTMGKEASKHKPTGEKAATSTALKVPTGGKPRSKSFNAGDRGKLTVSPSGTPPTGTPKSSPGNSPKPMRRNAMSKDMSKKRPSEAKKQDTHGRPHSDPVIAEKIINQKKSARVAANDASSTGKSKLDIETLKNKVKDLELENSEFRGKIQAMEHRLAVVPLLEKEKLHLQKQFNEIFQENDKRKSELESNNLVLKKQTEERAELQARHDKQTTALENSQAEIKELQHQNQLLEEVKSTLVRENDEKVEAVEKYLDNIANLTSSNTALVLQEGRSRSKILTLLQGLQSLKDSVIKLKEENKGLQSQIIQNGSELAGTMKNCASGLEKVLDSLAKGKNDKIEKETQVFINIDKLDKDTQCGDLQSVDLILAELEESKKSVACLKTRISELQKETTVERVDSVNIESSATPNEIGKDSITDEENTEQVVNEGSKFRDCAGCVSLQARIEALSADLDSVRLSLQKSETERDDAVEERNELRREAKYLKYVLSYREDVQSLQNNNQQAKEMEKLGTNLVEAEKKVIDLEDEVGRLQQEKQTLLLSILNLYSGHEVEDVREEDEGEAEDEMASEDKDEQQENKENVSEVFVKSPSAGLSPRTPESASRREQLKFRFQLSLSESEYSYSSEPRTEGEDSDSEEVMSPTVFNLQTIKTENKQLKTSLLEANEEKEELLSSLDKLCEEYDSLKASHDKLEEEHSLMSDRASNDKIALQARLRQLEIERENMRDSLRQVQDEKLALLKCLEMKNVEAQPLSPLPDLDLDKIIARAQSFTREENKSSEPTSNEEDSEASLSSETEDDAGEQAYNKDVPPKTPDNHLAQATPEDKVLAGLVASIENDLGKLKERLNRRDSDASGDGHESRPKKPPPGARMLKRQASTVKSNLDRVCREKQHLQDEVESLRRYLLKRRDSAMDLRKTRSRGSFKKDTAEVENHLEGIKTLQVLLEKSDKQLRQSNEIIFRLEATNDENEEKLRDSELLQEDMRHAVQIANNFAMEEQQKAEEFALQNQELLKQIDILKRTAVSPDQQDKTDNSKDMATSKGKSKFQMKGSKPYNRNASEDDYEDDESTFTTEGESDFYSSRHSSIASESDFVRSPRDSYMDNMDTLSHDLNSNVMSAEESTKSQDTEPEGTSQHSSTVDTSDTDEDKE